VTDTIGLAAMDGCGSCSDSCGDFDDSAESAYTACGICERSGRDRQQQWHGISMW
jgi:hypothetical protein